MKRLVLLAAMLLPGCSEMLLPEEPPTDAVTVFDALWQEFDAHYASFEVKRVDWDSIHAAYRPRVSEGTTPRQLFELSAQMLESLRDGHVTLVTPVGTHEYDGWHAGYARNYEPAAIPAYLQGGGRTAMGGRMRWGLLRADIGYVHIGDFGGDGWGSAFDEAVRGMPGIRALVLDVRSNGGGSDGNAEDVAGRMADSTRAYLRVRYRDGPAHDDFGPFIIKRIGPEGARFRGRVAVLTNRGCFSATETFVISMRTLPHAVTIGDTTGGGLGNPYWRELPNGWTVRVPRWQAFAMDGTSYEDVGVPPDIAVQFAPGDAAARRDPILERAIAELGGS